MLPRLRDTLWVFLFPVSLLWALAAWVRRTWYPRRKRFRSPLKIISVGNLHSGGSGKTPVVIALAKHFSRVLGAESVVILSRGYRASESKRGARVALEDPRGPAAFGDEPWMMAQITGLPVFVGRTRAKQLRVIEKSSASSPLVLLDDGFQHLSVARDFDLVLIHTDRSPQDGFCLPLGDLREPFSSLNHASAILLVSDRGTYLDSWEALLEARFTKVPRFVSERSYTEIQPQGKRVLAFCGVAHPASFAAVIESRYQGRLVKAYRDHHEYQERDVASLLREGTAQDYWVTTDKDFVKAAPFFKARGVPLHVLGLEQRIPDSLLELLKGAIGLA